MAFDRVTITGADDSVNHNELIAIQKDFPFVEWGILASFNNTFGGSECNRYPSPQWISDLQSFAESGYFPNLALHINGTWVRQLLRGNVDFNLEMLQCFRRVQLNFHAERSFCFPDYFANKLNEMAGKDWIFQLDGANGNTHMDQAIYNGAKNCYGLFDTSGGSGILPKEWPKPIYIDEFDKQTYGYCGYAGGLGPDNLAIQIPAIIEASRGNGLKEGRIWLDMESNVRSDNDRKFDLQKVRRCLEIAAPYVTTGLQYIGKNGGLSK